MVTEREAHLQQIISCLIESRKQEQALWEKQYSELQETIHMYVQGRGVAYAMVWNMDVWMDVHRCAYK